MWIVDFACLAPRIVIEVDGESHEYRNEATRTWYLESLGFTILRFHNLAIATNLEGVVSVIESTVRGDR